MDQMSKLAEALASAQGMIEDARKDSSNPHFKSRYADLASVRAVIKEPLAKNGLSVMQIPRTVYFDIGNQRVIQGVEIVTILTHKSGEKLVSDPFYMPCAKPDAHGLGSAITYARRYSLSAILNVASDDDDGNAASDAARAASQSDDLGFSQPELDRIELRAREAAVKGRAAFEALWKQLTVPERRAIGPGLRSELEKMCKAADGAI